MNLLAEPAYVLDLVSRHHRVPVEAIVGPSKVRDVADARMTVCYVLRLHGGLTNTAIGAVVGRDQSTVSSAVTKISLRLRAERVERDRLADVLADVPEASVLLIGACIALTEARAVVGRLEALVDQLEQGARRHVA